ncbi:Lyase [Candidatus Filomicrobium marinum]|uniref:Lyase n=1 Tax=Candidatus Filomicrobium marinum TaxID=1608628 RepID=A0A0D6JJD2_9HYPH|nr:MULTISPECIES: VOC family protein [Filomicrobium]MCV0371459.1 VOC family protein [Filomicrobium sp.]CFX36265.1 Lyase [Candidatus Filomicrobium marinum]CPR21760.1 Lyase [Candidatus Filomicrobium marinum]
MIDHVSVAVRDLELSGKVYEGMLAPLGLTRLVTRETAIGFGKRYPELWLNQRPTLVGVPADTGFHICLRAPTEDAVRAFFDIALAEGCISAGAPGPRQAAMTPYFAAFVYDPDGNKIEAANFPSA